MLLRPLRSKMTALLSLLAVLTVAAGPTLAGSVLRPAPSLQTIYAGSLQNGWQYWGWGADTLDNSAPALSAHSIKASQGAWQAIYLHHAATQTLSMAVVSFWINGGPAGGQSLVVKATRNGAPQAGVALSPLAPSRWRFVSLPLSRLQVSGVGDMDGLWIQNNTPNALPAFYVDRITINGVRSVSTPAPAAPTGLAATPAWEASCPKCGGMAMAHVMLAWDTVPGATAYTVYRDGVKLTSPSTTGCTDMDVVSGKTYAYAISATGPGGESARSASVSATAPNPPTGADSFTAPVNLCVAGVWSGAPTDTLSWLPVPGAVSYTVYQYGVQIGNNISGTSFTVPASVWSNGLTYTVTAVDSMGMESLPSSIACAQGAWDPNQTPSWDPGTPVAPTALSAVPEWNGGKPRIHLAWRGAGTSFTYTLYRDGQRFFSGLWDLNAYDTSVLPGETHSYTVTASNISWTKPQESDASASISAMALSAAPLPAAASVQITNVEPNDDSVVISFAAVPGAADYRAYDVLHPNTVKYSGGSLSIEMNGLDPVNGANIVVEAVDKLGPFQTMDCMAGPGAMQMDGMHSAINGQGDPSNLPLVLATSVPVAVKTQPRVLAGEQMFFDTFRNEQPLVEQPMPVPMGGANYGEVGAYASFANDKWTIRDYGGDLLDSKIFFMGSHFMDTLYDGGTPRTNSPIHNNNASLVMMPNTIADISGGKVLHVTFEVDAHMDGRRWCDVFVGAAGDTLVNPGKFADFVGRRPTVSGKLFRWEIQNAHSLSLFPGEKADAYSDLVPLTHQEHGVGPDSFGLCARMLPWCKVPWNGTPGDLDKRHKFDLYLSKTRAVIMEQNTVIKDVTFPGGYTLPFDKCQVYFVHQLYHTNNDRHELIDYSASECYWFNNRPYSDERHWDNMGCSVLDTFPTQP